MQEGVLSLMQIAKVSAVLAQLAERRLPYIVILTNPATGGVSASYAMLGDAILAEPGAVIGFAGPRVIEQTIRQKLPEGFQRSEFLVEHGMLDLVVDRRELKAAVIRVLRFAGAGVPRVEPAEREIGEQEKNEKREGCERESAAARRAQGPERKYLPQLPRRKRLIAGVRTGSR